MTPSKKKTASPEENVPVTLDCDQIVGLLASLAASVIEGKTGLLVQLDYDGKTCMVHIFNKAAAHLFFTDTYDVQAMAAEDPKARPDRFDVIYKRMMDSVTAHADGKEEQAQA